MAKEFNPDILEYGKEKRAFDNKGHKRRFETSSTRAAVKGPTGEVTRGYTHANVYEDIAKKAGKSFDDIIDEAYDPISSKPTGAYEEGFSKYQEGKFRSRAVEGAEQRLLNPRQRAYATSEEISIDEQARAEYDPAIGRKEARAGSINLKDQERRRTRAKRTHGWLEKMKEEEKLLRKKNPNSRKSPEGLRKLEAASHAARPGVRTRYRDAVQDRIRFIDRRKGLLKALGRKAGLLGVVASPYTTGEALVGLGSKNLNDRLRSVEILQGLPDFSTGRGLTKKEKEEQPIWHDPTTGEWRL
jgi:hypothetical protein